MNRYRRSKRKFFSSRGKISFGIYCCWSRSSQNRVGSRIKTRSRRRLNRITLPDTEECANYRISTHPISTLDNQGFHHLEFFATVTVQLSCCPPIYSSCYSFIDLSSIVWPHPKLKVVLVLSMNSGKPYY